MKICIDIRSAGPTGIGTYSKHLVKGLLRIEPTHEYVIIRDPGTWGWAGDRLKEIVIPSRNPLYWLAWSNTALPRLLDKEGVDIYHSVKHVTALYLKPKAVLSMHGGAAVYMRPELYKAYDRLYWKAAMRIAAKKYDAIIMDTDYEKRVLADCLRLDESKFSVAHLAASENFRTIQDKAKLHEVEARLGLPSHFILFVGMIHPRKNLDGILRAYKYVRPRLGEYKLVVVGGRRGPYQEDLFRLVEELGIRKDVLWLGHLGDDDLPYVYNLATLFVLPSHYENFGIIYLEAMASGVPVISSDIPDIDEVVRDAAIRVDPKKYTAIGEAIIHVLSSAALQAELREKGLEQSRQFSWDRCAMETLGTYEKIAKR
jgi:glycosyltransferase involved in cell wall biosynthesis